MRVTKEEFLPVKYINNTKASLADLGCYLPPIPHMIKLKVVLVNLLHFSRTERNSSNYYFIKRKMQIQVKCSCGAEKCPEWAIIELQGVVELQPSFQDSLQNLQIGQLCRPSSQENYTFTIGYHELTGSKVALKKPMVVLKKIKRMDVDQSDDGGGGCDGASSLNTELDVVGVIRHKILFKTRLKALISVKEKAHTAAAGNN